MLKTKDLLHRRQEFYENKIAQLSLELNQVARQSKASHGSLEENRSAPAKMYHDKMAQTVPTLNSISVQTGEMELGSSILADAGGVNHRNLADGEESSPSEDSMVLEEDEATSKYYRSC